MSNTPPVVGGFPFLNITFLAHETLGGDVFSGEI